MTLQFQHALLTLLHLLSMLIRKYVFIIRLCLEQKGDALCVSNVIQSSSVVCSQLPALLKCVQMYLWELGA